MRNKNNKSFDLLWKYTNTLQQTSLVNKEGRHILTLQRAGMKTFTVLILTIPRLYMPSGVNEHGGAQTRDS